MDKTVPTPAAYLLEFIGNVETGNRDGNHGYDTIWNQRQKKIPALREKPITKRTVDEWLALMPWWGGQSSASGRYQFMKDTLADLKRELGLRGVQVMDPNLQDRLGYHLLRRRGYDDWILGKISDTIFGKQLAQEWASLPVLAATKGAHRNVFRGQSYYEGSRLNKSLISAERVEKILTDAKALMGAATAMPIEPDPLPLPPTQAADHSELMPPTEVMPIPITSEDPLAIPFFKSKTFMLALGGFFASLLGLYQLYNPALTLGENFEVLWPVFTVAVTSLVGTYSRYVSKKQPLTLNQADAEKKSAEMVADNPIVLSGVAIKPEGVVPPNLPPEIPPQMPPRVIPPNQTGMS